MSAATSYNNSGATSVQGEVEYPADPASGAFFQPDYKKNDDLKMMLDSSKDSLKLESMKRIIGMIAKGRDASDLFPAVVKNVVSKNIEVKKLVYVYLVRYAEEQQDLALLSISTFQRALKDPNQLIRASALRVLSSIRVSMIVPIVMLAIRESASDMSPYVRKTAAHAIPKLYSLEPEHVEELVSIIDKLLSDKAPLVVGSAAMAFQEVCPERSSLIHRSYRKLCSLLVDVDEWGQLVLLSVLTRYAREHFCNPNAEKEDTTDTDRERPFYEESDSDTSDHTEGSQNKKKKRKTRRAPGSPTLDADHKLLLRAAKPLLQSRNSGVVMAVAQLFYHAGPACDLPLAAKALIRLLRGPFEVQSVVLHSIASLTISKRSTFEPYLKSFFIRTSDPTHIKLLKLEILTNLATETTVPVILREFQTYVNSSDKAFAGATIQAIGRIAADIEQVTETCLNGLLHLLSSKDEWVVGEAVVVVKRVVRGAGTGAAAAVARASRLLRQGRLAGAGARAAALWLLAEHGAASKHAPALLAHFTSIQQFSDQDELVKLQLLSLAVKLCITQPETEPLARHILTLARYDACYDVRDRARLLRKFIEPEERERSRLLKHAALIFLAEKPVPLMESKFKDRQQYTLGSLSHYVGTKANGYAPLPAFPAAVKSATERDPDTSSPLAQDAPRAEKPPRQEKHFYSEPESSSSDSSSDSSTSEDYEEEYVDEDFDSHIFSNNREQSDQREVKTEELPKTKEKNTWKYENSKASESGTSDSESDSSSSSDSDSSSGSKSSSGRSSHSDIKDNNKAQEIKSNEADATKHSTSEKSNLELLLELDEVAGTLPIMTPSYGGFLSPMSSAKTTVDDSILPVSAAYVEKCGAELVSRLSAAGLSVVRRYTRAPHLFSHKMAAVELTFNNHTPDIITDVKLNRKTLTGLRAIHEFAPIPALPPGGSATTTMGVDFADTIQPVCFTIQSSLGEVDVSITPPVGELMRAVTMSEGRWDSEQRKLRGMNECDKRVPMPGNEQLISQKVFETANLASVTSTDNFLRFAGRTLSAQDLVLVSVRREPETAHITVNCSNMAVASLLLNQIVQAF